MIHQFTIFVKNFSSTKFDTYLFYYVLIIVISIFFDKITFLLYNRLGDKMEKNCIILITGAAGNIAQATIKKYLGNNCTIIATDIKEKVVTEFDNNPDYEYYQCDATNVESITSLRNYIQKKYNRITHIISMAGDTIGTDIQGIEHVTISDIDKTLKLNLYSHIYLTTIMLPLLKNETASNKSITYVSSINALRAYDCPIYSASKAALYGLVKGELCDLGKLNIRANIIAPGTVLRPHEQLKNKQTNGEYAKARPQPKYLDFAINEDIADAFFSITHVLKKVTGQDIVIDAGQMA